MGLRDAFSNNETLRGLVLPVLRRSSFDFAMRHPWVEGEWLTVNSYRHKGYWFFARNRERESMDLFGRLIAPGAHVAEVGGHIGFITGYFARLAGPEGRVTAFEPGSNNLPYIRKNIAAYGGSPKLAAIALIEKAVGPKAGSASFYEDDLTGQNNSIIEGFDVLASNSRSAHVDMTVEKRTVEVVSLDDVFRGQQLSFVKIDVEGFEYGVLQGMQDIMRAQRPVIMVEVQASEPEIFAFFAAAGYRLFSEQRVEATKPEDLRGNMFGLHAESHADEIRKIFG